MTLRVLDLFSGIGGFSLGLERTGGFKTVAFCEIDPFARRVLEKHWPEVPCYDDVRSLTAQRLAADGLAGVDVICGGFPCQDLSKSGRGSGLAGERSGLWFEYQRIIADITPSWVIIENVTAIRTRGLDTVLRSLSEIRYDAEWHCIPANAVGAPHQRDRVWVVAYPSMLRRDAWNAEVGRNDQAFGWAQKPSGRLRFSAGEFAGAGWLPEPSVDRVVNGVPRRVDRLRCLGNAVVPQIPEMIGRAILAAA